MNIIKRIPRLKAKPDRFFSKRRQSAFAQAAKPKNFLPPHQKRPACALGGGNFCLCKKLFQLLVPLHTGGSDGVALAPEAESKL